MQEQSKMVYTLSDFDGNVFYVGRTQLPLSDRLKQHIWEVKYDGGNQVKKNKIKSLEYKVLITPLDCADTEFEWIKWFLDGGIELTNIGRELRVYELTASQRAMLENKIYNQVGSLDKFLKVFNINRGVVCRALRLDKYTITKEERGLLVELLRVKIKNLQQIIQH